MSAKRDVVTVKVKVRLEETEEQKLPKETPDLLLHAFDRNGELLYSAPLEKAKGGTVKADLELPAELEGEGVRMVVGPAAPEIMDNVPPWMEKLLEAEGEERDESGAETETAASRQAISARIGVGSLLRAGGFEKRFSLSSATESLELAVYPPHWIKWLKCKCVVRGRLIKRVPLPDGTTRELGVCHACVKIYEVDAFPKIILRLADRHLYRLRDDLRRLVFEPVPKLPPDIGQVEPPPPGPTPPIRLLAAEPAAAAEASVVRGPQPEPPTLSAASEQLRSASAGRIGEILEISSPTRLRHELAANAGILAHYLCIIPWLAYWFHKDLIRCVCTDADGRFETTIWYTCAGDKPDLYFRAVQCIGGQLHVLYDPGVACHTYWNYACGTEVLLETDDPAARVCTPSDPITPPSGVTLWIMPYGIGGTRLDRIQQPSGLTNYSGIVNAPFGANLGFRHGYSSQIPYSGIRYYRWLYKKEGTSQWREFADPVAATIVRHFVDEDLSDPSKPPTFPAYTLGPQSINSMHLYEFKPHQPPALAGHHRYWPPDNWFAEIYSGFLRSTNLPGGIASAFGRYKFKLEIYDGSGTRVAPGSGSFRFIVPTGLASDGVTILSRNAYASEIENDGFVFYLHIDNRHCQAAIPAPAIGTVTAGDVCGFLRYAPGDEVRIAYAATHPANFATHHFWMRRGIGIVSNVWGEVSALSVSYGALHSYTGDGHGNFVKTDFSTTELLGTCAEGAFAEILRVYAKATNGWNRIHDYDAGTERAFALAPKP